MTLQSAARVFGDFAAIDINFNALSTLYYDPMSIELGATFRHFDIARLYAQLDYQFWGKYEAPALLITQPQTDCEPAGGAPCGNVQIAPGSIPLFQYVNIVVPRIAEEIQISEVSTLRIGYFYRGSILKDVPNGAGNFLDPSKHVITLGWALSYPTFLGLDIPTRIDFLLTYQYLLRQTITKTPGNEAGVVTDSKIGSPGYVAGGFVVGGGATLSLTF
jgi:hypothetical protein